MEERQQQIKEKMDHVHLQQKESIEERERLLEQMEEHQILTHREENEKINKQKQREEEIMEQVIIMNISRASIYDI